MKSQTINKALCRDYPNPDLWFPEATRNDPQRLRRIENESYQAIHLCNQCPIKEQCLEVGLELQNIQDGIWGGLFPYERRMIIGRATKGAEYRWQKRLRAVLTSRGMPLPTIKPRSKTVGNRPHRLNKPL